MRLYREIMNEIDLAMKARDAAALHTLADEMASLDGPQAAAAATHARGRAYRRSDSFQEALQHYERALSMYEALEDHVGKATVIGDMAAAFVRSGSHQKALTYFEQAIDLYEALGERHGVARAVNGTGIVHSQTGEYQQAIASYQRALALFEELGSPYARHPMGNIGIILANLGDNDQALAQYHAALGMYQASGDRGGAANIMTSIGNLHAHTGNYPQALESLHRALAEQEELGHRLAVAGIQDSLGNIAARTGDYPTALEHHHRALAVHEALNDHRGAARVTGNMGNIYGMLGDHPTALAHYRRALEASVQNDERQGIAVFTGNIGNVYADTGDHSNALEYYQRARTAYDDIGDRAGSIVVTNNIVGVLLSMGSNAEAEVLLDGLYSMRIDDPGIRITRDWHRAELQARSGDLDEAVDTLRRSLSAAVEHGLRHEVATVHGLLRDLALKRNDFAAYVEHNGEFTRITEEINGKETATKLAMQVKQREIEAERRETEKHMAVLHSTLPRHIADRVARGEAVNDHYDNAVVIFLDIVDFTSISDRIPSGHVVHLLEQIFTTLDAVCQKHDVIKIKTIGDSYMAVSFDSAANAAACSLDMIASLDALVITMPAALGDTSWTQDVGDIKVRIGMHCGPLTAGVIGIQRMQYDVWGDTVNVASRMESTSEPGRIHVSEAFANHVRNVRSDYSPGIHPGDTAMIVTPRGVIDIKGKGAMQTFWLEVRR